MKSSNAKAEVCPVCDWKLDDKALSVHVAGRTVKVCCDECRTKLLAAPEKFLDKA